MQFDAAQVLRLVAPQDVITLDPATIHQASVGLSLARNVFGGLYQFRDDLVEMPDLAKGPPEISPDGLTWTFHLNANARFSNGTPVTAADVVYSWNRVARLNADAYPSATIFDVVQGYTDVQARRATKLVRAYGARRPHSQSTAHSAGRLLARRTRPVGHGRG